MADPRFVDVEYGHGPLLLDFVSVCYDHGENHCGAAVARFRRSKHGRRGAGERCGALSLGDVLVSVGGTYVAEMPSDTLHEALLDPAGSLGLAFPIVLRFLCLAAAVPGGAGSGKGEQGQGQGRGQGQGQGQGGGGGGRVVVRSIEELGELCAAEKSAAAAVAAELATGLGGGGGGSG